jgi:hypothetical protein
MRRLGKCIVIGPRRQTGRTRGPRAGAYGLAWAAYCPAASVPAQLERGLAGPGWRGWTVSATFKEAEVRRDNREMATLGQRVNFVGVTGARCEEAQTAAR